MASDPNSSSASDLGANTAVVVLLAAVLVIVLIYDGASAALNVALMLANAYFLVRSLFPYSARFLVAYFATSAILVFVGAYIVVLALLACVGVFWLGNLVKLFLTR